MNHNLLKYENDDALSGAATNSLPGFVKIFQDLKVSEDDMMKNNDGSTCFVSTAQGYPASSTLMFMMRC